LPSGRPDPRLAKPVAQSDRAGRCQSIPESIGIEAASARPERGRRRADPIAEGDGDVLVR
jgi:hypothetical protein